MKRWFILIFIFLFIALSYASARSESMTFDEAVHIQDGINALTKHTFTIDTNNPPLIRELAMLPTVLGAGTLLPGRIVVILLGALTLICVYLVTKRYFGQSQALLAAFLLALEPNFLANSHYVTLDTGTALLFFLGYMAFVRLMERYSIRRVGSMAVACGLAFSSKMTAIPFLLLSTVVAGASLYTKSFRKLYTNIIHIALFIGVVGFVIWGTYFFTSPGNYLTVVKNTLQWPGPGPDIFFFGRFYPSARWYFVVVTFLLKLPIPLLTLFILGLFAKKSRRTIALFVIPVFAVLVVTSVVNNQPWFRYLLPAIPFIAIVASESITMISGPVLKVLFLILCLWYAYGTGVSFPHYISYANELAGPPQSRYRIFMDSNLDWGQSLPDLARYIKTVQPGFVSFSYFGRDNADLYGLTSDIPYATKRYEDTCAFHHINLPYTSTKIVVAISVSNWYYCGYSLKSEYSGNTVRAVVAESVLLFYKE